MRIHILSIVLCCLAFTMVAQDENLKFEHYNDGDGLSHNAVRHILQDKHGFIWLGTFGGLNRFDGYEFKSYLSSNDEVESINDDDVTSLFFEQDKNRIWIGTRGGLTTLNLSTYQFKTYLPDPQKANSIPELEIRSIFKDKHSRVWIGTKSSGLGLFDPEQETFESIELPGFTYVKVIFQSSNGDIWLGSYGESGVARLRLNTDGAVIQVEQFEFNHILSGEPNPYVSFIYEDDYYGLIIGTRGGLFCYNEEENKLELLTQNSAFTHFNCIHQAPDGRCFIGTKSGLIEANKLKDFIEGDYHHYVTNLADSRSLVDNYINTLFFDNSGVLWLGTENGLEKFDPYDNQFRLHKGIGKLLGNKESKISGFAKSYDGKVLVATHNDGLFAVDLEKTIDLKTVQKDLASIYSFDGKTFYCGLWNGDLLIYNYYNKSQKLVDIDSDGAPLMSFCKLNNKQLMAGTFGAGLFIVDIINHRVEPYNSAELGEKEINKLVVNAHSKVWMATESGVVYTDPATGIIQTYSVNDADSLGLSSNSVSDIYIDRKGMVWAASRKGLNYFDPVSNEFRALKEPQEIHNSWVTDLVTDSIGIMWLNLNNNRIAKFDQITNDYHIYRVKSGNRLDVFSKSSFYYYNEDYILLGGQEGIIHFSPSGLQDNKNAAKPFISGIRIHNKEVMVGQEVNGQVILTADINESNPIELSYNNRNFSLTFSAPVYVQEKYNQFRYKLEGYEDDWNTVGVFQRTVQYTNLFFRDYTFKVQAKNNHGYWSDVSEYDIKVLPPIWLSYYAIITYLVLIISGIVITRRLTRRQLMLRHELMLERVKRERDEKLNQDKLRFFTNISHELRTPLTLILGPARQLLNNETNSRNGESLKLINNNAERLLTLVNQILDFRKVQDGSLKLKVTETDFYQYIVNTYHSFQYLADEKNIQFELYSPVKSINGWIDSDKLDKVLYNLLSNAFKFTPQNGKVTIELQVIEEDGKFIKVAVKDTGIGLTAKEQKQVFNRFYQSKAGMKNNTGTGIGLNLVKHLVKVHKGELMLESKYGEGSTFAFIIPLNKTVYAANEVFDIQPQKETETTPYQSEINPLPATELKDKVLVVEDNNELRSFITSFLSVDFEVYEAENGKVGLEKCKEIKPIMCIVDVMMPVMDGLEFCTTLKNDVLISHIPVVLLTALAEDENKIKGYKAGADGYIGKPFEPEVLSATIQSIISNRKRLKEQFSSEGTTEIDYVSHSPADEVFMNDLKTMLDNQIEDPNLMIKDICEELGMSASKLYRKLKEITDLSPNEFIRTMRLKKATVLLKSKQYNVSEVAVMVGFNDPLYFSRCFKKQFGISPSQF